MTEWNVQHQVPRIALQGTLDMLTRQGYDIYELTYVQPVVDSYGSPRNGDYYCVVAVKY
jgi:hypothetical protein